MKNPLDITNDENLEVRVGLTSIAILNEKVKEYVDLVKGHNKGIYVADSRYPKLIKQFDEYAERVEKQLKEESKEAQK